MAKTHLTRDERTVHRKEQFSGVLPAELLDRLDPAVFLGDIDAWNLRQDGGFLRFDARLETEPRAYMKSGVGGDIIADAPGALFALLALGGPRRAGFNVGPAKFRYNVLAPADHIGTVGLEGTAVAAQTEDLQHLRHRSREALLADHLLADRYKNRRGLPLFVARAETDSSDSITALADGPAFSNILIALDNIGTAAKKLGRKPHVVAIAIGFGAEDIRSDSEAFAQGFRRLMSKLEAEIQLRNMMPPIFLAEAESGASCLADHPAIKGYWELAHRPGPHRLIISTPSYAVAQDRFGRPTEAARDTLAEIDSHALAATLAGQDWQCPLPLLAEYDGRNVRVIFRATTALIIDPADPFGAGPTAGFRIMATDRPIEIQAVRISPNDPRSLILECNAIPEGQSPRLCHACGLEPNGDGRSINRSAIRDLWQVEGSTGATLHRWALPADLPLYPAPRKPEGNHRDL